MWFTRPPDKINWSANDVSVPAVTCYETPSLKHIRESSASAAFTPEVLKKHSTHNLKVASHSYIFSAPHLHNHAKRFPITFSCNYQSSYQKGWSWEWSHGGALQSDMGLKREASWWKRSTPAKSWKRSTGLALGILCHPNTTACSHLASSSRFTASQRRYRHFVKPSTVCQAHRPREINQRRTLQNPEVTTWTIPRSIQQMPLVIFPSSQWKIFQME